MVEIRRNFINLFATFAVVLSVGAQQIKPRVDGLESNARYMNLLTENSRLTEREDSIASVVVDLRRKLRTDPDSAEQSSDMIISFESRLFELRARKAVVIDSLNLIEQDWVISNMKPAERVEADGPQSLMVIDTVVNINYIYQSDNVRLNLPDIDYQNLIKAEEMELDAERYNDEYVVNVENMLALKSRYEMATSADDADAIMLKFDSLKLANVKLVERLDDTWGFIYDNKSFAYSLLMEVLGFEDVLESESEMMRTAQAEISTLQGSGGSDEILRYRVQKSLMLEYEALVGRTLNLPQLSDSLTAIHKRLSGVERVVAKDFSIEERLFIKYERATFSSSEIYGASNPIPQTQIYDKGLIFRIYLGTFREKQSPSIFRKTQPISYVATDDKRYTYYAGGYATLAEAEEAQKELKAHGFRKPLVVAWSDGKSRNLSLEPYTLRNSFTITIEDTTTLVDGILDSVLDAGSSISKVGNDKYVITPLSRQGQVDSLVVKIGELAPNTKLVVDKSEGTYKF